MSDPVDAFLEEDPDSVDKSASSCDEDLDMGKWKNPPLFEGIRTSLINFEWKLQIFVNTCMQDNARE